MSEWWVYIIEKKGKLYVGITTHLNNRLRQHGNPQLLYKEGPLAKDSAVAREKQIKGWSRDKKSRLFNKGPEKSE
ncbi:hypothetical protein ES703_56992 [subsurface metagenome]